MTYAQTRFNLPWKGWKGLSRGFFLMLSSGFLISLNRQSLDDQSAVDAPFTQT